jgi:hypothetical protein
MMKLALLATLIASAAAFAPAPAVKTTTTTALSVAAAENPLKNELGAQAVSLLVPAYFSAGEVMFA